MPENTPGSGLGFPPDNPDGTPGLVGKDDYTRWEATQRINKSHDTVLAGNYADLQRIGAELAVGNAVKGVAAPPGVDPKSPNVVTPAQHEAARGEYTRETARTGLVDERVGPEPAVNTTANPVDPGSKSPTVEAKKVATK